MIIRGRLATATVALLGVSLAANLLVAGFVVARYAIFEAPSAIERIVMLGARTFPGELRRAIIGEALGEGSEVSGAIAGFRQARRHMFEAMRAAPFDPAELDTAFAEVQKATDALQDVGQKIIGEAVKKASPEARAAIRPPED